jgi:ABC-type sugar transport system ATPase subunit
MGIIFNTHFIDQVYEISNRITVLRQGELWEHTKPGRCRASNWLRK